MKQKSLLFILCFILFIAGATRAQYTVTPSPDDPVCPLQVGGSAYNITDYGTISLNNLKGCTLVSPIDQYGRFVLSFTDKKEEHSVTVHSSTSGTDVKVIKFTKVNTLNGISPKFPFPPTAPPPLGYDDMLPGTICYTNSFNYTGPTVKYKDATASANEYGNPMAFYEWLVPSGWKVNGNTSNGVTPIIVSSPTASITPDALTGGGSALKMRAKNNCNPNNLLPSNWYQIYIDRPVLKLVTNGATSLAVACGSTSTHTFTVQDGNLATCVTSYDWDLGSDNNNWLLNGIAAPRTFSTPTNSVTLTTSTCTGAPTSISVALKGNGTTYGTFSLPVTMTAPSFEIIGANYICSTETYSINPLPCNASVSWSLSPFRNASFTVNGNTATVTKLRDGSITLTATISGVCGGSPVTIQKFITTGAPTPMIMGPYDPVTHNTMGVAYSDHQYYFEALELVPNPASTYTWVFTPYDGSPNYPTLHSGSPTYLTIPHEVGNCQYTLQLTKTNSCGTATIARTIYIQEYLGYRISTAPNPAKEELTLTIDRLRKTAAWKKEKTTIILYDFYTSQIVKQFSLTNGERQYKLNLRGLKKGNYILQVTEGKSTQTKHIMIE